MQLRGTWTYFGLHNLTVPKEKHISNIFTCGLDGRIWIVLNEKAYSIREGIKAPYIRTYGLLTYHAGKWSLLEPGDLGLLENEILIECVDFDQTEKLWLYASPNFPERMIYCCEGGQTIEYRSGENGLPKDMGVFSGFAFDKAARAYIGIGSAGLFYLDNGRWHRFESGVFRKGSLPEVGFLSKVVTDPGGKLWVAWQAKESTTFFHHEKKDFVPYATVPIGHELTHIGALAVDRERNLWVGWNDFMDVIRMGLWKLPPGGSWEKFTRANSGLPDEQIQAITFDNKKRMWVASMGGLTIFEGSKSVCWNAIFPGKVGTPVCRDEAGFIKGTNQRVDSSLIYVGLNVKTDSYGRIWSLSREGIARFEEEEH